MTGLPFLQNSKPSGVFFFFFYKVGYFLLVLEYFNFLKWGQIKRGSYFWENNFCSFTDAPFTLTLPHFLCWSFRVFQGMGRVLMILTWPGPEPVLMERSVKSRSCCYLQFQGNGKLAPGVLVSLLLPLPSPPVTLNSLFSKIQRKREEAGFLNCYPDSFRQNYDTIHFL